MLTMTWCVVILMLTQFQNWYASGVTNEPFGTTEIPNSTENELVKINESNSSYSNPVPQQTPIFKGECDYSTCPDNSSDHSPRDFRPCKCDKYCVDFRDCCSDSEYYRSEDQQRSVDYECHKINNYHYFLKRTCASSWDDIEISSKCSVSKIHDIDTEEIELRSPITSLVTNITYGNLYCAICNYEWDDVVLWNVSVGDCYTLPTKKFDNSGINSTATWTLSPPSNNNGTNLMDKSIKLSFRDLSFDGKSWFYEDEHTRYDCKLGLQPPSNVLLHYCSDHAPLIRSCPASNSTDENIIKLCKSITSRVYNWRGIAYKNKYCAYCHGLNDFNLTCDGVISLHSLPFDIMRTSFSKPRQQFTVLFDFKLKKNSKICNDTRKSFHKIQKKLCPRNIKSQESKPLKHDNWFLTSLSTYTFIAVLISLIFLLFHLTIFFIVQELQTIGGKNLASFCVALILAYSSFLCGNFVEDKLCYATSIIMYYSFLSAFFWMLIISYDMWNTFRNATKKFRSPKNVKKTFVIYSILVWSTPLILVFTTLYLDLSATNSILAPHFGYSGCWFDNGFSLLLFFVGPVCVILIVNFVLFLHTSYMLHSNRCESVNQKSRVDFKLFTRIGLLTGFTWITGFVAGYTQSLIIWFIFVVLNTAQGVFIFTAFSCKKRVIQSFLKRINKFEKWQRNLDETNVISDRTTSTPLNDNGRMDY